ncbi:hypothetical protein [Flavobacterium sp. UBA6195]|uniref:hypothetical protein n=1 Tax=Flavobacterium sp. UBA6195 TaxID=1946554 RepID=UPI0025BD4DDB|nr:hypothetical protein [Flavobacterium sp. UBA6195]
MNIKKLFSFSKKAKIFNLFDKAIETKSSEILLKALHFVFKEQIDLDYVNYFMRLLPEAWHEEHEEIINLIWLHNLNDDVFSDVLYLIAVNPETYRKYDDENESILRKCIHVLREINSEKSNLYIEKLKSLNNPNVYFALENYN